MTAYFDPHAKKWFQFPCLALGSIEGANEGRRGKCAQNAVLVLRVEQIEHFELDHSQPNVLANQFVCRKSLPRLFRDHEDLPVLRKMVFNGIIQTRLQSICSLWSINRSLFERENITCGSGACPKMGGDFFLADPPEMAEQPAQGRTVTKVKRRIILDTCMVVIICCSLKKTFAVLMSCLKESHPPCREVPPSAVFGVYTSVAADVLTNGIKIIKIQAL